MNNTSLRTQRATIEIPIRVVAKLDDGSTFEELTKTHVVNAAGGLISLRKAFQKGTRLLLINLKTDNQAACTVANVQSGVHGKTKLGIVFDQPMPLYWGIAFPPADWARRPCLIHPESTRPAG